MASRVVRILLRLSLYFALSGLVTTASAIGKDRGFNADSDWLGLIAGDQAGAEIVLGTEMAELFAASAPLRVVPMPGDAGLGNIERLLLAAKSKDDPGHGARVTLVVDTLFSGFAELQGAGHHPKWREINLAAGLPGWTRTPEAETWLAQHPGEEAEPVTAKPNIEAGAALPPASPVGHDRREALFKQFIEWQRAKGH
jgi:hypothetical protein